MTSSPKQNPLPKCPVTPNCARSSAVFTAGIEQVFEALSQLLDEEALSYQVTDPKRIKIFAVYRIPVFGFKDNVDFILEESGSKSVLFIRSASRLGAFDFGVNTWRVKRIISKLQAKCGG